MSALSHILFNFSELKSASSITFLKGSRSYKQSLWLNFESRKLTYNRDGKFNIFLNSY